MEHAYSVKLSKIVKDLDVELIYSPYDLDDVKISSMDVNRPGLQLGGFFEYFDSSRNPADRVVGICLFKEI